MLGRTKASHKGVSALKNLRELMAFDVNQDFFDEICELDNLEYLHLNYPVTAVDISGIKRLSKLKTLKMDSVRKVSDFTPVLSLPHLHTLIIANAKNLTDIEFLESAHHLKVIGVEGSMWTKQKIQSLRPLSGLQQLEALFMTTVVLEDQDLIYLASCPKLRILDCARFAPKSEFERLRRLMPDIECRWCEQYDIS